jgi:hypothetical protein
MDVWRGGGARHLSPRIKKEEQIWRKEGYTSYNNNNNNNNSMALVREQILIERPPLVGEIVPNFGG